MESKTILITNATNPESLLAVGELNRKTTETLGRIRMKALVDDEVGKEREISLLRESNVEVIRGSMIKKKDVLHAIQDVDYVFLNLDYPMLPSKEFNIDRFIGVFIEACKEHPHVKHIIYTTVPNYDRVQESDSDRLPKFYHLAQASKMLKESGLPITELQIPFWMNKLFKFIEVKQENVYGFNIPLGNANLPLLAMEDIGRILITVLENTNEYRGKSICLVGDALTPDRIAETYSKVLGRNATATDISVEKFREWYKHPNAHEVSNIFSFFQKNPIEAVRDERIKLETFESWLRNGNWGIPSFRERR